MLITNAQMLNITGRVVDEDDEPIKNTIVILKGTTNLGAVTDSDGKFKLIVEIGDTLEFRYIGYDMQEIIVKDDGPLFVKMVPQNQVLICDDIITYTTPTKAIYAEAFGASTMVGMNYDSRFKGNKGWGYRVGLSYAYSRHTFFISDTIKGVAVPLEINYLFGKRKSKFELGAGVSLGYYKENYDYIEFVHDDGIYATTTPKIRKSFGYFMFFNIGYRLQPVKGFDFRIGITPSFNFGDKRGISRTGGLPYISFGYAFR